jgi:hypothetical protein
VTLPLILARRHDEDLLDLDPPLDAERAAELCYRIAATGALDASRDQALAHVAEAKRSLKDLDLPEPRRRALELVADGVVARFA